MKGEATKNKYINELIKKQKKLLVLLVLINNKQFWSLMFAHFWFYFMYGLRTFILYPPPTQPTQLIGFLSLRPPEMWVLFHLQT